MRLHVVILAGGQGSRFWPVSKQDEPKQFLALEGTQTLLQLTYQRALTLAAPGEVYVMAPPQFAERVHEQLGGIGDRYLAEPVARDTASAIVLASAMLRRRVGEEGVIAFLPSDHYVRDLTGFASALGRAAAEAERTDGLCVLGLEPSRPETDYGYIVPADPTASVSRVRAFVEKPPATVARQLLAQGALWNVGVVVASQRSLTLAAKRYVPEILAAAETWLAAPSDASLSELSALPRVSFDKAVLEQAAGLQVVRGRFAWDDVGTWTAYDRIMEHDASGNVTRGRVLAVDTERTILVSEQDGHLLAGLGVKDLVCVATEQATLIASKAHLGELKRLAQRLAEGPKRDRARPRLPEPAGGRTVPKAWGREVWWAETERYVAKVLEVEPGQALSLQYHEMKVESMLVLSGNGTLTIGDRKLAIRPGLCVDIPAGTVHRVEADDERVTVLEVSTPEVWDVVRLEDRYGRVTAGSPADAVR